MARCCQVENRIHAILDFRRPLSQRLSWSTAVLLAAAIIPLIALAAALQPSSGKQDGTKSASTESSSQAALDQKDADQTSDKALGPTRETAAKTVANEKQLPDAALLNLAGSCVDEKGKSIVEA